MNLAEILDDESLEEVLSSAISDLKEAAKKTIDDAEAELEEMYNTCYEKVQEIITNIKEPSHRLFKRLQELKFEGNEDNKYCFNQMQSKITETMRSGLGAPPKDLINVKDILEETKNLFKTEYEKKLEDMFLNSSSYIDGCVSSDVEKQQCYITFFKDLTKESDLFDEKITSTLSEVLNKMSESLKKVEEWEKNNIGKLRKSADKLIKDADNCFKSTEKTEL